MRHRTRLTWLERAAAAQDGTDLVRHWTRQWERRRADLEHFLAAIPEAYEARVVDFLPRICELLFVAGPAWAPEDDPAFVRWAVTRADWGRDHPFNRPLPDPIPAALLDLFLDHPGAELGYCPGCRATLPFVPASGELGVPYRAGRHFVRPCPISLKCPVCGGDTPPPRLC
ncbi:hypothetical protein J0H58_21150 [bacterium]|nr:hypothetical protein [bacterium]